jgi:hypothetical protein
MLTPEEKPKVLDELERQLIEDQLANREQRLIRQAQYAKEFRQGKIESGQEILVAVTSKRFPNLAEIAKQCAEKIAVWEVLRLAVLLIATASDEQTAHWVLDVLLKIEWK